MKRAAAEDKAAGKEREEAENKEMWQRETRCRIKEG